MSICGHRYLDVVLGDWSSNGLERFNESSNQASQKNYGFPLQREGKF
jgi:hypothetical protein